jgi:Mg-chelatase subunit ChlD
MTATQINLANLDVYVLLDRSGSMGQNFDTPSKQSRWDYAKETIVSFVMDLGKHDDDGITLVPFNASHSVSDNVKSETFGAVWSGLGQPVGGTMLASPLRTALGLAEKRWKEKQQLIVVLTDGEPSDRADVAQVIIDASKKMERDEQTAILFLQVGQDTGAKAFLASLDDDLQSKGAKFDIVDADSLDSVAGKSLQDVVNKAFND